MVETAMVQGNVRVLFVNPFLLVDIQTVSYVSAVWQFQTNWLEAHFDRISQI